MFYKFRLFSPFVHWMLFAFQLLAICVFLIALAQQSAGLAFIISLGFILCVVLLLPTIVVAANHYKQLGQVNLLFQDGIYRYSDESQALEVEFTYDDVATICKIFPSRIFLYNGVQSFFLVEIKLISGRILLMSCMHGMDVEQFSVVIRKNTFLPIVPDVNKRDSSWSSQEETWYK